MPTLNYPLEEEKYKAKVVFGLVKREKVGDVSTISNFLDSKVQSEKLKEQGEEAGVTENEAQELNKGRSTFTGSDKSSQKGASIQVSGDTVGLYLPAGLAFSDGVKYDNFDLGGAGAGMEAGVKGGLSFVQSLLEGGGSFINNITSGSGTDLARLAGIQLSSKAGQFADEVRAVQKLSGGLTLNPNERVLFDRPNMRTFNFTFKFIAKSEEEALQIDKIVKFFRTELYPDEITQSLGNNNSISLGYRFPNKFSIAFQYDGKEIKHLSKIKPCFLQDVNTVYNASQMAMHSDGHFTEVDMTLTFRETVALTRKDVEKGGF